jgi:hypothetical protein
VELLTNSRAKTFRDCALRHHYQYVLGYLPRATSHPLWFGDVAHRALQAYWECRRDGGPDALEAALSALPADADAFDLARLRVMLTAYAVAWDREDVEVLAVEQEFTLPLLNPLSGAASRDWQLAGKIDLVLRYAADGRTVIVEHKTSSQDVSPGSDYRRRLTLDTQVSQYVMGGESLGYAVDAIVYDVLRKPKLEPLLATPPEKRQYTKGKPARPARPATAKRPAVEAQPEEPPRLYAGQREADETPAEFAERLAAAVAEDPGSYLERVELHRFEDERARFAVDVWKLAQQIGLTTQLELATANPGACFAHHGRCFYLPVCERTASLDDPHLYHRPASPHAELSTAA